MIYIKENLSISERLKGHRTTKNMSSEVYLAVIELPSHMEAIKEIPPHIPIIGVLKTDGGVLNFKQAKILKEKGVEIVNINELEERVNQIIKPLQKIISGSQPITSVQTVNNNKPETLMQDTTVQYGAAENVNLNPAVSVGAGVQDIPKSYMQPAKNSRCYIAISFSTAGGVGKTFLCTGLAACAALGGIKTVAVDFDLRSSELDFAIGLTDPVERNKIIDKKAQVPPGGWLTLDNWRKYCCEGSDLTKHIIRHNSGLYIVPCYPGLNVTISKEDTVEFICTLSQHFELIILDGGVDFMQPHIGAALEISDAVFLIGDQEIKTIGKVSGFLAHVPPDIIKKTRFIVNMVTPTGYYAPDEVATKLQFTSYDEIPFDKQGVSSAKRTCRTVIQIKESISGEAIKKIAQKHLPFCIDSITVPKPRKNIWGRIKMLFKRRMVM